MNILIICGSPRNGNSEAMSNKLKKLFNAQGMTSRVILLREKNIQRCNGCVEYCNKNLRCCHTDDVAEIITQMIDADGYIFIFPNYFAMPPGICKDFMDKCSVLYTSFAATKKPDLSRKYAGVIVLGTDQEFIDACRDHVAKWFCETLQMQVVVKKSFRSRSELKGNSDDIFDNKFNPDIDKELEAVVKKFCASKTI